VDWLKELLAGTGSLFSLVLAFVILPSFYLKFAFDMQKEYVDLAKTLFSSTALSRQDKEKFIDSSQEALQVFQVEWGLLWAIAILTLANFCAVFLVERSSFGCKETGYESISVALSVAGAPAHARIACEKVKGLLSLYGVASVLLILFQIWWAKVSAMRRLREIYVELSLLMRKERGKTLRTIVPVRRRYAMLSEVGHQIRKHE
jgi:hypothetical protein